MTLATGDLFTDAQSWLGLAIAVVLVAGAGPGPARIVRYTLLTVIAYVLLTNTAKIAPAIERFNASLPIDGAGGAGGGGGAPNHR